VQGALEGIAGVDEVIVDFDRREALIRFDPQETDLIELTQGVASAGGYRAALKYGPVVAEDSLNRILTRQETGLSDVEALFAHTAVFQMEPQQVRSTLRWLQMRGVTLPDWFDESSIQNQTIIFVSLWSNNTRTLPVIWSEQVRLLRDNNHVSPEGWIRLAEHTESNGTGSIAGMLVFPDHGGIGEQALSLVFSGFPDEKDHIVEIF